MADPAARRGGPPVIGLAGSIGAGKSTVAAILAEAGCVVSDSDRLAREVLADPACAAELASWWGPSVLDASGAVDRAAVARIVFARPEERTRLERLVHPRIHERRARAFAAAPPGTPALVIDAPLLFEVGLDRECDRTILVDAPRELRLARVRSSRGWDEAELRRREESQWPLDRKRRAAHHVLVNDADLASLRTRVLDLLRRIHAERQVAS
ncbi:MAG: dephospho-CoA kinase [Phycisphaerae bacterium]|nr:dephospho-CoA kinase [Phycisphaerae bacterium]